MSVHNTITANYMVFENMLSVSAEINVSYNVIYACILCKFDDVTHLLALSEIGFFFFFFFFSIFCLVIMFVMVRY